MENITNHTSKLMPQGVEDYIIHYPRPIQLTLPDPYPSSAAKEGNCSSSVTAHFKQGSSGQNVAPERTCIPSCPPGLRQNDILRRSAWLKMKYKQYTVLHMQQNLVESQQIKVCKTETHPSSLPPPLAPVSAAAVILNHDQTPLLRLLDPQDKGIFAPRPVLPITLQDYFGTINIFLHLPTEGILAAEVNRIILQERRHPHEILPAHYYRMLQVFSPYRMHIVAPNEVVVPKPPFRAITIDTDSTYLLTTSTAQYKMEEDDMLKYCRELLPCGRALQEARYSEVFKGRCIALQARVKARENMLRMVEAVGSGELQFGGYRMDEAVLKLVYCSFSSDPEEMMYRCGEQDDFWKERYEDGRDGWRQMDCLPHPACIETPKVVKKQATPHLTLLDMGPRGRHWYPDYLYLQRAIATAMSDWQLLERLTEELTDYRHHLKHVGSITPTELFIDDREILFGRLYEEALIEKVEGQQHADFLSQLETKQCQVSSNHLAGVTALRDLPSNINDFRHCLDMCAYILSIHAYDLALKMAIKEFYDLRGYYLFRGTIMKLIKKERREILDILRDGEKIRFGFINRNCEINPVTPGDCMSLNALPAHSDSWDGAVKDEQLEAPATSKHLFDTELHLKDKKHRGKEKVCEFRHGRKLNQHYLKGKFKGLQHTGIMNIYQQSESVLEQLSTRPVPKHHRTGSVLKCHHYKTDTGHYTNDITPEQHLIDTVSHHHKTPTRPMNYKFGTVLDNQETGTKSDHHIRDTTSMHYESDNTHTHNKMKEAPQHLRSGAKSNHYITEAQHHRTGIASENQRDGTVSKHHRSRTIPENHKGSTVPNHHITSIVPRHHKTGTIFKHYRTGMISNQHKIGPSLKHDRTNTRVKHHRTGTISNNHRNVTLIKQQKSGIIWNHHKTGSMAKYHRTGNVSKKHKDDTISRHYKTGTISKHHIRGTVPVQHNLNTFPEHQVTVAMPEHHDICTVSQHQRTNTVPSLPRTGTLHKIGNVSQHHKTEHTCSRDLMQHAVDEAIIKESKVPWHGHASKQIIPGPKYPNGLFLHHDKVQGYGDLDTTWEKSVKNSSVSIEHNCVKCISCKISRPEYCGCDNIKSCLDTCDVENEKEFSVVFCDGKATATTPNLRKKQELIITQRQGRGNNIFHDGDGDYDGDKVLVSSADEKKAFKCDALGDGNKENKIFEIHAKSKHDTTLIDYSGVGTSFSTSSDEGVRVLGGESEVENDRVLGGESEIVTVFYSPSKSDVIHNDQIVGSNSLGNEIENASHRIMQDEGENESNKVIDSQSKTEGDTVVCGESDCKNVGKRVGIDENVNKNTKILNSDSESESKGEEVICCEIDCGRVLVNKSESNTVLDDESENEGSKVLDGESKDDRVNGCETKCNLVLTSGDESEGDIFLGSESNIVFDIKSGPHIVFNKNYEDGNERILDDGNHDDGESEGDIAVTDEQEGDTVLVRGNEGDLDFEKYYDASDRGLDRDGNCRSGLGEEYITEYSRSNGSDKNIIKKSSQWCDDDSNSLSSNVSCDMKIFVGSSEDEITKPSHGGGVSHSKDRGDHLGKTNNDEGYTITSNDDSDSPLDTAHNNDGNAGDSSATSYDSNIKDDKTTTTEIDNINDTAPNSYREFGDLSSDIISCDTSDDEESCGSRSSDEKKLNNTSPNDNSDCDIMALAGGDMETRCYAAESHDRHKEMDDTAGRREKRGRRKGLEKEDSLWEPVALAQPEKDLPSWEALQLVYGNFNTILQNWDHDRYLVQVFRSAYKLECERWQEVVEKSHMHAISHFQEKKKQKEAWMRRGWYKSPTKAPHIDIRVKCKGRKSLYGIKLGWMQNHVCWLLKYDETLNLKHHALIHCMLSKEQPRSSQPSF